MAGGRGLLQRQRHLLRHRQQQVRYRYIATVEYKGEVTRTSCDTVLYTATFASHGETQIKNSPQPTQAPAETDAPVGTDSAGMNWAVLVIPAALLMGLAGFGGWKLVKYMKNKKRGYV